MELVKVTEMRNRLVKNLSKGYRQRVGLCQAMVGSPDVIILDEPTVGLDPKQIIEMRTVIKDLGKNHTVILSSHILSEVSAVCDRVMIINKGEIVASDTPDKLGSAVTGQHRLQIRVKGGFENVFNVFNSKPFAVEINDLGSKEEGTADISITGHEGDDIREITYKTCAENGIILLGMKNLDLTLEEIFLQITSAANVMAEEDNEEAVDTEPSENTEKEEVNIDDSDI
jgi:ABC-2 type transport system ATP-binding protein